MRANGRGHSLPGVERTRNVIIGPRYQVRLEDLRDWHVIEVTCGRCGREGLLYPSTLRRRLPDYIRLLDLERRYACKGCGNRFGNTWRILEMSRNA